MTPLYGERLVKELRNLCETVTERLWIAVPFIGGAKSVRRILGKRWLNSTELSIRLLTDITDFNHFNSETIQIINKLGEIRHLAGLHAKIFIIDNTCLITSANLTNTAFSKRYEIGLFLDHPNSSKAISIFNRWWRKSEPVAPEAIKTFRRKRFISYEESDRTNPLPYLWDLPDDPGEMNYWLKPIGVTGDPITEDRTFDDKLEKLHFSKIKPKGIKIGDILIAYGVGAKRILSIYEVMSEPKFVATNQRWPWYVLGRNLSSRFGKNWAKHGLYAEDIREQYLRRNPKKPITKVGGTTFGGFNLGKDKLKLDPEFAQYVIRKITKLNS